jgi:hypothetical protein
MKASVKTGSLRRPKITGKVSIKQKNELESNRKLSEVKVRCPIKKLFIS